ncbi:MAG: hypothetical protein MUE71_06015 [Chitinophagaceae bacterium]|nr:hypothetical protein [Chitinophagaceae bacterium]
MRSVISMFKPAGILLVLGIGFSSLAGYSQVNSPYSRFGIGDLYYSRNVSSKGMGGLATTYKEIQSINFINPASYAGLNFVTLDVGIEAEFRTLTDQEKANRFESSNLIFNYLALGVPLAKDKKGYTKWGMAFGIRPYSRVRYDIISPTVINGIDSAVDEYRGNGGLYRGFLGMGYRIGNLSVGVNAGYVFGQKEISTYRSFPNNVDYYYTGSINQRTSITMFSMDGGFQYEIPVNKTSNIRIGANGYLGGDANGNRELVAQTIFFDAFGQPDSIDVVERKETKGVYTLPAGYSAGISFEKTNKFMFGAEYETSKWSDLTDFGEDLGLGDVSMLRLGGYWIPDVTNNRSYWKQVVYRAGFFTGKDYVVINNEQLPVWGITFGGGFPIRRFNNYSTQFNTINLSFEYGRRGSGISPYVERYFKVNLGLALSDIWFIKRQYD